MSSLNNYRVITLIQIISKLFECIGLLLEVRDDYLNSDNRQFGFKKHLGCASAMCAVRSTMDYINERAFATGARSRILYST